MLRLLTERIEGLHARAGWIGREERRLRVALGEDWVQRRLSA